MRRKMMGLAEAAALVRDGDLIALTHGVTLDTAPMGLLRQLLRQGLKALRLVGVTGGGLGADLLLGAGALQEVETCHMALGDLGVAPNFQRLVEAGRARVKENTCGVLLSQAGAGAMGVPFVPVRGLLGSDLLKVRPDFTVAQNPFSPGERVVLAPAVTPDVVLFHATLADVWGNFFVRGRRDELTLAQASRRVLVTAERVVEGPLTPRDGEGAFIPSFYTSAVVHLPFGAHPTPCPGLYEADLDYLHEYIAAARSEEGFRAYLEKYVYGVRDEAEYLERVGVAARGG